MNADSVQTERFNYHIRRGVPDWMIDTPERCASRRQVLIEALNEYDRHRRLARKQGD